MLQALDQERTETPGERLDPFALPIRFASEGGAQIFLDRKHAVLRRGLSSGLPLSVDLPISAYRGIAARLVPVDRDGAIRVSLELLHADPALTIPLAVADEPADLAADWQAWGKALALPLLVVTPDGKISEADPGDARRHAPAPRRARRFMVGRRPRFLGRRKPGRPASGERVAGREIIARS